ncbi:MAG: ABC transporter ATP-binding protein [Chloroflexi bacterium]|nr:MAG: ABC transporter ATP-binding protein [Chloroflexota bacterium]
MLTIHNVSKAYGLTPILKNITLSINPGDRIGLIGPNGCGKSTLMRILTGQEPADSGHVTLSPPSARVGYLAQGFEPDPILTFKQLLHQEIGNPEEIETELGNLAMALAETPDREDLQQAYDETLVQLNRVDYGRINTTLTNFELDNIGDEQLVGTLSGGQKTRLSVVLMLLNDPQLLLLDEPTNHLDITMLEWLESWLTHFNGGALIVSHDRTFLDRTVNRILDLNPNTQTMREYAGNYTDYLEQFLNEQEKQWAAYKDQVYEIRRMKQDIARTREQANSVERSTTPRTPGPRAIAKKVMKKAKSREKKLDRYLESDERVEKPKRNWQMKLDLDNTQHLGKDVVIMENLSVGYAGHPPLLKNVSERLLAGQRVVITGPNGSGKTTLLRTIIGKLPPVDGIVRLGASVKLGYMSQEQELLNPNKTALETIQDVTEFDQTETRSFLHFFLFSDDDPLRPIANLSFGERARLSLAKLVASGCNLLLLDEPINHLDIPSRTRFEQALSQFEGTVLAVVHDRYFIEQFATKVWYVVEGKLETWLQ